MREGSEEPVHALHDHVEIPVIIRLESLVRRVEHVVVAPVEQAEDLRWSMTVSQAPQMILADSRVVYRVSKRPNVRSSAPMELEGTFRTAGERCTDDMAVSCKLGISMHYSAAIAELYS